MQNIDLICIGKMNASYFASGVAEYQKRLGGFCNFRIIELPEASIADKNASDRQIAKALQKESDAILASVRKGAYLVALCVEGKQISSEDLAALLAERAASGAGDIAFVIGSSHGLDDRVKKAAQARISMGRITLPHQLARLVPEQLACTINAGMKYPNKSIRTTLPLHHQTMAGIILRTQLFTESSAVRPCNRQAFRPFFQIMRNQRKTKACKFFR